MFQDEVHFQQQSTVCRMWAERGSTPQVKSRAGHDKVSYSGFVVPSDGSLFMDRPEWFSYETVIDSIRAFLHAKPPPAGKRYYLVMDNAPWHRKAKRLIKDGKATMRRNGQDTDEDFSDINACVTFVYMPPYSPDLNPIEQVWRKTRRETTHNRYFESVESLGRTLDTYFLRFADANEDLRGLCSFD